MLHKGALLGAFSFFALALFSMTLAIGPEPSVLQRSGPALIWILAILTTLFSTPLLLKQDENEGILDQILLQQTPLAFSLLSKSVAEYLLVGLPLTLVSICLSSLFAISLSEIMILSATLLIGFPALSCLGILGGLLTINSRGGGILMTLLILPLTLPLLLFSLSAVEMTQLGLDSSPSFCLLTSVSIVLVIVSLMAGTRALRLAVEG